MAELITSADVAALDNHALRRVLNALLQAEADLHGVPLTDLDTTLRENDPDAGIDARIRWKTQHEVLRDGENVVQYKSGKLTEKNLRDEFAKPGVQDALKRGGHYILMVGHAYGVPARDKRAEILRELCAAAGIDPGHCRLAFGDHIARWVSRFPSLVIRKEFDKGLPGFATVEDWQHLPDFGIPFRSDKGRDEIINEVRSFVAVGSEDNILRIEGEAGVGKSRLALEALNVPGIAQRTMYAWDAANWGVIDLLSAVQSLPQATAVIVVDECDREQQEVLRPYVAITAGRVRLICVGAAVTPYEPPRGLAKVFRVKRLADDEIREILTTVQAGAPREVVDVTVRLAEGMVKLAIFIADTLVKAPNLALTDLVNIPNVQTFLQRFVDPNTFKGLQALSLLARTGWADEVRVEAESVAKVVGVAFVDLQAAVKRLKDRGVVLPRGRYLYVSPDLLAISAAAHLWDERGPDLIQVVADLPGPGPRRQLLIRLAMMAEHPPVRGAVAQLLGTEGLYKTLADLDKPFLSEVFRFLASALPESAVKTLERLLGTASDAELLGFKEGRRHVMWAIESLLRWPETSLAAARVLRRLALAENESIGNNATGVFASYFFSFLSGSPIPLRERLKLVWDLIDENTPQSRELAVKATSAALSFHEIRMGDDTNAFSRRPYPKEWQPKTWPELWDARRLAVSQLLRIVASGADQASRLAREALIQSVFTLIRHGQAQDAVGVLAGVVPESDAERLQLLEAAERLKREAGEALGESQREQLQKVIESTFGASYFGRLRRWVGHRLPSDFDLEGKKGYVTADQKTVELADEGFRNGVSDEELKWLASTEAEHVWVFGKKLGELDNNETFLHRIIPVSSNDLNAMLLGSYLVGHASAVGDDRFHQILDDLAKDNPVLAFTATWRGQPSERSGNRVIRLMESGSVQQHLFRALMYGGWVTSLPDDLALKIIQVLAGADPKLTNEAVLFLLDQLVARRPQLVHGAGELIWEALESTPTELGPHGQWLWGQLAGKAAGLDPARMADLCLARMRADNSPHLSNDPVVVALSTATNLDPEGVWEKVGKVLLHKEAFAFRLLLSLERWYGELIPVDSLLRWAKEHTPIAPLLAARLLTVGAPLSERARRLLLEFPDDERILHAFAANLQTGTWVGSMSSHDERILATVQLWQKDDDPRVRAYAERFAHELAKRIDKEKILEEENFF